MLCLNTAAQTSKTLPELKSEVLNWPACSPDLAPFDFHLSAPLTRALRHHQFEDDDEVKEVVHVWLCIQSK
jgi:hypothetical protein